MGLRVGSVVICEHEFEPEMEDELGMKPGHRIRIVPNLVGVCEWVLVSGWV